MLTSLLPLLIPLSISSLLFFTIFISIIIICFLLSLDDTTSSHQKRSTLSSRHTVSITKEELVLAFRVAIDSRKKKYANTFAYHFHWQNDGSSVDKDAETFVQLANLLGFENPETDIIPHDADTPGFELTYKIGMLLKCAHHKSGNSVVLLHYSGHAVVNQNNELVLTNQTGKQISADRIMADICSEFVIPLDAEVDVVVVMDCCHSYLFTRSTNKDHRRVDVLSAGNREDPKAYSSCGTFSFTSKLSVEIQKRAQRGDVDIEMAHLVSSLRETSSSPVKTPTYAARLGLGSVVLPIIRLTPTASTTVLQDTSIFYPSRYLATFSLHIAETLNRSEIDKILHWIHQASKKETSTLRLENVKRTNSTLIILESAVTNFYRIAGLPGLKLICANFPI